jgi:hypothetical protein
LNFESIMMKYTQESDGIPQKCIWRHTWIMTPCVQVL